MATQATLNATVITIVILVFSLMSCSIISSALQAPLMIKCEDNSNIRQQKQKKKIIKYF